MANRSYLYACNQIPGSADTPEKRLVGLSECNYAVPLIYKIMLSANPSVCRSRIWNTDEQIAIIGGYREGVRMLADFLAKISHADVQPQIEQTLAFLNKPENNAHYLLLECGEIFDMQDEALGMQNNLLLDEILDLENAIDYTLYTINRMPSIKPSHKLLDLFKRKRKQTVHAEESDKMAAQLGLNNWSNNLYFDFS